MRAATAITALLVGLGLPACGDDDDGDDGSNAPSAGSGGSGGSKAGSGGAGGKTGGSGGSGGSKAGSGGSGGSSAGGAGGATAGGAGAGHGGSGGDGGSSGGSRYGLLSRVTGTDNTTTSYFATLDSLGSQTVDFADAREFGGSADAWLFNGKVYVAEADKFSITRYKVEAGALVQDGEPASFQSFGLKSFGFWLNTFISPTKAYLVNGASEYIVWNPETMLVSENTIELPPLADKGTLKALSGYSDRAAVIRDGKLYQPFYWTSTDYFSFDATSSIVVFDTATDTLVKVIDVACPGLDHVTQNADGDLFFSAWIFAVGGATVLDQPETCVAKVAKDADEATVAFKVKDVTNGLEGGVLRFTGDGKGILSVLDPSHAAEGDRADAIKVTYADNWRFWSYDFGANTAAVIDAIDWNAGAAYPAEVEGTPYSLIPASNYASTAVWDISTPATPEKKFDVKGWTLRLFELP